MGEYTRPVEEEPEGSNGHGLVEDPETLADKDNEFIPEHGPDFPGTTDPDKT